MGAGVLDVKKSNSRALASNFGVLGNAKTDHGFKLTYSSCVFSQKPNPNSSKI